MKRSGVIANFYCDCFYTQVELVRLALQVSYAARTFGIKRGENVADIARKGAGKVRVVHV